jgi:hypothetical protein
MFRISKIDRGWIVEELVFKYKFLGIHFWQVWRPLLDSYFKTKDLAFNCFQEKIKYCRIIGYYE